MGPHCPGDRDRPTAPYGLGSSQLDGGGDAGVLVARHPIAFDGLDYCKPCPYDSIRFSAKPAGAVNQQLSAAPGKPGTRQLCAVSELEVDRQCGQFLLRDTDLHRQPLGVNITQVTGRWVKNRQRADALEAIRDRAFLPETFHRL